MNGDRRNLEAPIVRDGRHNRRLARKAPVLCVATALGLLGACGLYCLRSNAPSGSAPPPPPPPVGWVERLPAFPWPPPRATHEMEIPANWLPTHEGVQLGTVRDRLKAALKDAKYEKLSYWGVYKKVDSDTLAPNGFALVTQLEQISVDGSPRRRSRFSASMPSVSELTLIELIRVLGNSQPGHYRIIAFIVTDQPWTRKIDPPTEVDATGWLREGHTELPKEFEEVPYGKDYKTVALVYEFSRASEDAAARFLEDSPVSAKVHLDKAGIAIGLKRPRNSALGS